MVRAPTSTLDLDGTLRTTGNALFQGDFVDHFKPGQITVFDLRFPNGEVGRRLIEIPE
ncbi:MAG: hypothetical protein IH987_22490 [Planctomycetes bacterium]|nr:hypothetical protein [Planctomycetota bacterium]